MEKVSETTVRKELDEELKRNKPKDVRKLYDMLVKRIGKEDAYTHMTDILSDCYTLMPNGRYRLDAKKYGNAVAERLKEEKKNKTPVLNPKKIIDSKKDLFSLMSAAADDYEETPMSDFAAKLAMYDMTGKEAEGAKLYIENKDLFFKEIDDRIAAAPKKPVDISDLDEGEYRGYFISNLVIDIDMILNNAAVKDPSMSEVHEDYLRTLLSKEISWESCPENLDILEKSYERVKEKNHVSEEHK